MKILTTILHTLRRIIMKIKGTPPTSPLKRIQPIQKTTSPSKEEEIPQVFDWRERAAICKRCPHFRETIKQCSICLCFMPLKVRFKAMKCPDNPPRWGPV